MRISNNFEGLSENELLNLMRNGDQRAFVTIYNQYWEEMYTCAFHVFPNRETCEDLIHDVFLNLWTNRQKLQINSLRNYLYIAVKNRALNKIRSSRSYIEIGEAQEGLLASERADHALGERELSKLFETVMSSLPEKCKQILSLSRNEHLSNKEIAARLNIAPKTVENQINIALKKIRMIMGDFLLFFIFYFFFG